MRKVCCVWNPRSNVSQRGIRITSSERYRVMSVHCMEQTPTSKEAIQKCSWSRVIQRPRKHSSAFSWPRRRPKNWRRRRRKCFQCRAREKLSSNCDPIARTWRGGGGSTSYKGLWKICRSNGIRRLILRTYFVVFGVLKHFFGVIELLAVELGKVSNEIDYETLYLMPALSACSH